jgi:two-component system, OmpR family, phosphate regulon sensor histidine kinase PhoR
VYNTRIAGEQMLRAFEFFATSDTTRRDGLGLGTFVSCQAIGLLGHRVEFASTPYRGSRFSVYASQSE